MLKLNRIDPQWLVDFLAKTCAASWLVSGDGYAWDIPEWRNLTGQSAAEVEGMGWANAIHPDDQATTLALWHEALAQKSEFNADFRVRCGDGVYRWHNARARPMLRANGDVEKWFGICFSIGHSAARNAPDEAAVEQIGAAHLRAARAMAGFSVAELASLSRVSASTIRRIEDDTSEVRTRRTILLKLIQAYKTRRIGFLHVGGATCVALI